MAKATTSIESTIKKLAAHKFDSSSFIKLDSRVSRDSKTGKLTVQERSETPKNRKTA